MSNATNMSLVNQIAKVGVLLGSASRISGFFTGTPASETFKSDPVLAAAMRAPARNTVGVWLRNAYWLAVASRDAESSQCQRTMLAKAFAFYIAAVQAASADASYYTTFGFTSRFVIEATTGKTRSADPEDIAAAYSEGIAIASGCDAFVAENNLTILKGLPIPEDNDGIDLGLPTGNLSASGIGIAVVVGVGFLLILAYGVSVIPKSIWGGK